jgi:WD40-like Beta Propeller Repeat
MLSLACLFTACSHTEPFSSLPGNDTPFDPGPPARLTLNPANDGNPSWLADGSGILYSAQQLNREDEDVCLAELPPTGGSQRSLACDIPGGRLTTDAVQSPAAALDGRIAVLTAGNGTLGGNSPVFLEIAVASTLDASNLETVRSLPLTPAGGVLQDYAGYLRWLSPTRLVYVGQQFRVLRACPECTLDTLITGTEVTLLDITGVATATAIAGTAQATGVAPIQDGAEILYTLLNDTRIYRRTLSSGDVAVFHDFGPAGVVRDVHASGGRVAAVVGGRTAFVVDPRVGPTQWDSGGVLHVLDLDGDGEVVLDTPERLYRRPAISPDGSRVVAEGFALIVTGPIFDSDTTVSKSGDIYLFGGE